MAGSNAVWGIDVGQCALKALRLQLAAEGNIEVTHFDIIEHPKILSQPDADADQLIRHALDKFLSRNDVMGDRVALSVPGQSSFARFIKLPPVEPKRIPEIVRFEAVQQIPFDIEEVEWDYQIFESPASPDVEVGIFAMRKELVLKHMANFTEQGIEADFVQLAPLALYNMMVHDNQVAPRGATILIDVGAENTDLVISDGDRIWLRSIPLGGNNFTEALVKAFKLSFSKAENLKRTAATSKYARQIFVAMRPVFGDLVSEVQRSIGFYTSLNRDAEMTRLVCLGNAFRLPGLQKYLEQNLQVETARLNSFNRLKASETINAPAFTENVLSFGVSYGLGLQGLGEGLIHSNLLPLQITKQRHWKAMRKWFAAAAGVMILAVGAAGWTTASRNRAVEKKLTAPDGAMVHSKGVLSRHQEIQGDLRKLADQGEVEKQEIRELLAIPAYQDFILQALYLVHARWPNWQPTAIEAAFQHFSNQKDETGQPVVTSRDQISWSKQVAELLKNPAAREQIGVIQVERLNVEYFPSRPPPPKIGTSSGRPGPGPASPPPGPPQSRLAETAQPVAGDRPYFRITIDGITGKRPDELPEYLRKNYLERILELMRADKRLGEKKETAALQKMPNIAFIDRDILNSLVARDDLVRPGAGGAGAPSPAAPAPIVGAQPGEEFGPPVGTDPMGLPLYAGTRFQLVFDLQIIPPVTESPTVPKADNSRPPARRGH